MTKERNSSIELLRIISMLMILALHTNYISFGPPTQAEAISNAPTCYFRIFSEHLSIVSVNIYILISGWFGIRAKGCKFVDLLIQVFSYTLMFSLAGYIFSGQSIDFVRDIAIVGTQYWFVTSYVLLFALSPVLNAFAESATKRDFKLFLAVFFLIDFAYGWYACVEGFLTGSSAMHFVGLYMLARYLKLHNSTFLSTKNIKLYATYIAVSAATALYVFYIVREKGGLRGEATVWSQISYNSPFVVLASVALFIPFTKYSMKSSMVNTLSKPSFAVYLIHCSPFVFPFFIMLFQRIAGLGSGVILVMLFAAAIVAVYLACVFVEMLRVAITPSAPANITERIINRYRKIKKAVSNQ